MQLYVYVFVYVYMCLFMYVGSCRKNNIDPICQWFPNFFEWRLPC